MNFLEKKKFYYVAVEVSNFYGVQSILTKVGSLLTQ